MILFLTLNIPYLGKAQDRKQFNSYSQILNEEDARRIINQWHEKYSIDFFEAPVRIEPLSQMEELKTYSEASLCVNEGLWKEDEFINIIDSRCGDYLCCSHYYVGTIRKFMNLAYLSNYKGWMIEKLIKLKLNLLICVTV